jgi:hypothetical protein
MILSLTRVLWWVAQAYQPIYTLVSSLNFIRPALYVNTKICSITSSSDNTFYIIILIYRLYFSFLLI